MGSFLSPQGYGGCAGCYQECMTQFGYNHFCCYGAQCCCYSQPAECSLHPVCPRSYCSSMQAGQGDRDIATNRTTCGVEAVQDNRSTLDEVEVQMKLAEN